jgi:hypothetical protein
MGMGSRAPKELELDAALEKDRLARNPSPGFYYHEHPIDYFFAALSLPTPSEGSLKPEPVAKFWDGNRISLTKDYYAVVIHSHAYMRYPTLTFESRLPFPKGGGRYGHWYDIGLDAQGGEDYDFITLVILNTWDYTKRVFLKVEHGSQSLFLYITDLMPTDMETKEHVYTLKMSRNMFFFLIDGEVKTVIFRGMDLNMYNQKPYALGAIKAPFFGIKHPIRIELDAYNEVEVTFPLIMDTILFTEGEPTPPMRFELYTTNSTTKWSGLTTSAAITSHPVPVLGYSSKTLLFQANAAATVDIEVYAGEAWIVYDSVTLTANKLRVYTMTAEVPIARCVYKPVGTDTINVAEWHLS